MLLSSALAPFAAIILAISGYQHGKIIGGSVADISKHPFVVSLNYDNSHICGGSVISNRYILTAAHCLESKINMWKLRIFAGSKYRTLPRQKVSVDWIKLHERYNTSTSDNDIAIIKLKSNLPFGRRIQPVALPVQNEEVSPNSQAQVLGWGYTTENGGVPLKLRKVDIPIVGRKLCNQMYSGSSITGNMICAGLLSGGKDSCQGDSGGPLIANGKLTGIVSWGNGCARKGYPGVYTQVSKYRNWIKTNTNI